MVTRHTHLHSHQCTNMWIIRHEHSRTHTFRLVLVVAAIANQIYLFKFCIVLSQHTHTHLNCLRCLHTFVQSGDNYTARLT